MAEGGVPESNVGVSQRVGPCVPGTVHDAQDRAWSCEGLHEPGPLLGRLQKLFYSSGTV